MGVSRCGEERCIREGMFFFLKAKKGFQVLYSLVGLGNCIRDRSRTDLARVSASPSIWQLKMFCSVWPTALVRR